VRAVDPVRDICWFSARLESVCAAGWHIERNLFGIEEFEALPVEIGGRVCAQIYDDVENSSVRAADKLRLPGSAAHVQAAHHAADRARLAVLDEASRIDPGVSRYLRIECAGEKTAFISMRHWLEQERAGDAGYGADLHEPALLPSRLPFRPAVDSTCI